VKLVRIKAIAKKESIQIMRDPYSLAMAFLMPVMLLFIFGYAITLDVDNLPTVVYDRDKSSMSRDLVAQFRESRYFTIVAYADDHAGIDRHIDAGKAKVAISIPEDFSKNVATGRDAPIQVAVDGSDSNTATIALGYIAAISDQYSRRTGKSIAAPAIDPRVRIWYNPELKSRNFIVPGLIAVIMAIIAALLSSLTISREWERGTMEQLISTPVKPPELIIGKLSAYFVIGFIDVLMAALIGAYLFDVPLKGSPLLLMLFSSLFLFGGLGLGMSRCGELLRLRLGRAQARGLTPPMKHVADDRAGQRRQESYGDCNVEGQRQLLLGRKGFELSRRANAGDRRAGSAAGALAILAGQVSDFEAPTGCGPGLAAARSPMSGAGDSRPEAER